MSANFQFYKNVLLLLQKQLESDKIHLSYYNIEVM